VVMPCSAPRVKVPAVSLVRTERVPGLAGGRTGSDSYPIWRLAVRITVDWIESPPTEPTWLMVHVGMLFLLALGFSVKIRYPVIRPPPATA